MPRYARSERAALADTLIGLDPDAPTLCEGWAARDLAAHLVLRDRRPVAALGIVAPPLAGLTARVQRRYAAGDFPALVAAVREGPRFGPTLVPAIDESMNLVEYFVHHEDLRRARPGWRPRPLPEEYQAELWRRVALLARFRLAGFPAPVTVAAPGFGERTAGRTAGSNGPAGSGGPGVTLGGAPGELIMFLFGRRDAAEVTIEGDPAAAARLRSG